MKNLFNYANEASPRNRVLKIHKTFVEQLRNATGKTTKDKLEIKFLSGVVHGIEIVLNELE